MRCMYWLVGWLVYTGAHIERRRLKAKPAWPNRVYLGNVFSILPIIPHPQYYNRTGWDCWSSLSLSLSLMDASACVTTIIDYRLRLNIWRQTWIGRRTLTASTHLHIWNDTWCMIWSEWVRNRRREREGDDRNKNRKWESVNSEQVIGFEQLA